MGNPQYSTRVDEALALVAVAFRDRERKGSRVPYLAHLLAVAALVAEHGGNENQIIAALLHDYLEDIEGANEKELHERFGQQIAEWVVALSDTTSRPKPPWQERKETYLAKLRKESGALKLVSAADKLHNAQSLLRDHRAVGEAVWDRFTATREQTLWYYRAVTEALGERWSHPILAELRRAVDELEARVQTT
jgi:GTP pyrophosphokinase